MSGWRAGLWGAHNITCGPSLNWQSQLPLGHPTVGELPVWGRRFCQLLSVLPVLLLAGNFHYKSHNAALVSLSPSFISLCPSQMAEWTTIVFQHLDESLGPCTGDEVYVFDWQLEKLGLLRLRSEFHTPLIQGATQRWADRCFWECSLCCRL